MSEELKEKPRRHIISAAVDPETFKMFNEKAWERRIRTNSVAFREAIHDWINKSDTLVTGEIKREKTEKP